jgi:hypothetical protein
LPEEVALLTLLWAASFHILSNSLRSGAGKSLAFPIRSTTKVIFLEWVKEVRTTSHKCVELRGEYVEQIYFFNPVACCFLYKAKDLSAPLVITGHPTLYSLRYRQRR